MNRLFAVPVLLATVTSVATQSSQAPPRLAFEVASVKPVDGGGEATPPGAVGPPRGGNVRYPRGSLRTLVMYAYDLLPQRHDPPPVGGPAWADSELYEVQAKGPEDLSVADARSMMRTLLEDRFKLRVHVERRDVPIYVLTLIRQNGSFGRGMRPAKIDCSRYSKCSPEPDAAPLRHRKTRIAALPAAALMRSPLRVGSPTPHHERRR